jgi:very-short-patch-repair endonuclease
MQDRCGYADFVCCERRLIIELVGGQHAENPEDKQRDCAVPVIA